MEKIDKSYKIEQSFKYQGDDWWKWRVWIEAEKPKLDKIDYVVYTLHSTFINPVRKIKDRRTKFSLLAEGWGVFTLYARIYLKDKTEIPLEHDLYLEYPDGKRNLL
jgi:transcription initiation factor IIF auxiliary subunit